MSASHYVQVSVLIFTSLLSEFILSRGTPSAYWRYIAAPNMSFKRPRLIAPSESIPSERSRVSTNPSHATDKYSCDECHLSYRNSSSLGRHKRDVHISAAAFWCKHCGRRFKRRDGLQTHVEKGRCPVLIRRLLPSPWYDPGPSAATSFGSTSVVLERNASQTHASSTTDGHQSILASTESPAVSRVAPTPATLGYDFMSGMSDDDCDNTEAISTSPAGADVFAGVLENTGSHLTAVGARMVNDAEEPHRERSQTSVNPSYVLNNRVAVADDRFAPHMYGLGRTRLARAMAQLAELDSWEKKWGECFAHTFVHQRGYQTDGSPCTKRRPPIPSPFPPPFGYPRPLNLEDLISQRHRMARRRLAMESFRSTHSKFTRDSPEPISILPTEAWGSPIWCHKTYHKQAWRDAVAAAHQLLSGTLPRELHSVLGVAQLASAIRCATDDIDSPTISAEKFLSDLGRWKQLVPSDSQAAFDYYADILWDNRPPSDLAWKDYQDAETLCYFQDLLVEMLSHIGSSPLETAKVESGLPVPDAMLCSPCITIEHPTSLAPVPDWEASRVETLLGTLPHVPKQTTLGELVLFSAGAIFAMILTYLMRKSRPLNICTQR